jgi:SAM-dependent methyltransferase
VSSEELSRAFYEELGADGLARRTTSGADAEIVATLGGLIPRGSRVLDAGCGYGRIALPLARLGHRVDGIDLSPEMVEEARSAASEESLQVEVVLGSMTELPLEASTYDAVICLWSAFNELLEESEQLAAVKEMRRVLAPGGLLLIEGRPYHEPTEEEIADGSRRGPGYRVEWGLVEGILNPHYRHDESTLSRLCRDAGFERFEIALRPWGRRERLVLQAFR